MALSGALHTMDLAELLQWLANSGKTGKLTLERERLTKRIGFREGRIVSVDSNDPSEFLGQFLLSYGKIDAETLQKAFAMQEKTGLKLGAILVQVNLLREKDLLDVLRMQAVEIIYNLFLWDDGNFRFDDREAPDDNQALDLEVSGIIMEGVYRYDEWKRYRQVFPNDEVTVLLDSSWAPQTDEDRRLAELVRQEKTIGEICYEFRTSKFHTYGRLYELQEKGATHVGNVVAAAPANRARQGPRPADLWREAESLIQERRYDEALPVLETVLARGKDDSESADFLDKADRLYRDILVTRFIDPHKVPRVTLPPELLTEKKFNPAEGYLISRIDGTWDIASIIRISPIPESEALGIFKRFVDENIVVCT
jgi:hypothetical protein